jgi:hypothetical protein
MDLVGGELDDDASGLRDSTLRDFSLSAWKPALPTIFEGVVSDAVVLPRITSEMVKTPYRLSFLKKLRASIPKCMSSRRTRLCGTSARKALHSSSRVNEVGSQGLGIRPVIQKNVPHRRRKIRSQATSSPESQAGNFVNRNTAAADDCISASHEFSTLLNRIDKSCSGQIKCREIPLLLRASPVRFNVTQLRAISAEVSSMPMSMPDGHISSRDLIPRLTRIMTSFESATTTEPVRQPCNVTLSTCVSDGDWIRFEKEMSALTLE